MSAAGPSARAVTPAPVFFPGATDLGRASRVTVAAGEERTGVDIQLQYVPLAIVSGSVQVAPGMNPATHHDGAARRNVAGFEPTPTARAEPDGRFTFTSVRPGQYMLIGRSAQASPVTSGGSPLIVPAEPFQWSTAEVTVDGDDVPNVALTAVLDHDRGPPRVRRSETRRRDLGLHAAALSSPQARRSGRSRRRCRRSSWRRGGRFVVAGILPGLYRLGALSSQPVQGIRTPIGGWWLKSVVVNGRDILDAPLDIRQGTDDAVATFTDQASEISGTVKDAQGAAASDLFVVIFTADRASWFFNSRRVAAVRADPEGRFAIRNLPPGEYRAVATADLEQNEWFDPAVLERLLPAAPPSRSPGSKRRLTILTLIR